jgi:N4-gp56 family major capsid protein
MSMTSYGVNAAEAVKLWSKRLAREVRKATYAGKFIGQSDDSLIQLRPETGKDNGDRVRITLRMQLSGDGVQGDSTLEGQEEALTTYTDDLLIDQLRHATRSKGKMSEQRVPFSVREEGMSGLRDWWATRFDVSIFNHLCGYTVQTDTRYTGNNAVIAATSTRVVRQNAVANDETLGSSDKFTVATIDTAVAVAKTLSPQIRPIKIDGEDHYVVFLHPYQVRDLRQAQSAQWYDIQKARLQGGERDNNPLFKGSLGVWNNCILHETNYVSQGVNSSTGAADTDTRRAILCGAQALALAFGKDHSFEKYTWVEELFDYQNQLGVSAGCIFGTKKMVFNSADFGVIVMPSYAAA